MERSCCSPDQIQEKLYDQCNKDPVDKIKCRHIHPNPEDKFCCPVRQMFSYKIVNAKHGNRCGNTDQSIRCTDMIITQLSLSEHHLSCLIFYPDEIAKNHIGCCIPRIRSIQKCTGYRTKKCYYKHTCIRQAKLYKNTYCNQYKSCKLKISLLKV